MSAQFPVLDHVVHLNHAAVGPWPAATAKAVKDFAHENASIGSVNYVRWLKTEQRLRDLLAQLLNARDSDEIALVKNTSEGLSFVAYGLDWRAGENVVGIQQEFPSNRFVWDSLASRGVEFRKLDLSAADDPEQALFELCDANTRLISISAVQYYNGFRMDLARVGRFCRERDILFCIDAIQQLGALAFDVQAVQADFVIADGHKWLLSPEGLGVFFVRREIQPRLALLQYGWHMAEEMGDYSQQNFVPAASARRFECGSPNMLGIHAMTASLELLLQTGMQEVGERVLANSRLLIELLEAIDGVEVLSNRAESRLSGIVTWRSERLATDDLYRGLSDKGVLCAPRGGGIRLSPHFYTPESQMRQVAAWIQELVST